MQEAVTVELNQLLRDGVIPKEGEQDDIGRLQRERNRSRVSEKLNTIN